jgi:hypothetical protein
MRVVSFSTRELKEAHLVVPRGLPREYKSASRQPLLVLSYFAVAQGVGASGVCYAATGPKITHTTQETETHKSRRLALENGKQLHHHTVVV